MGHVQWAVMAWQYRKQILIAAAGLLILPFLLIGAVVGLFVTDVPMVSDAQIGIYQQVVANLKYPDGQPVTGMRWQSLAAMDAVRFQQDFSQVTEQTVKDLAQMYFKEVEHPGGGSCSEGDPHCKCETQATQKVCTLESYKTYELYTSFEVADKLGFTVEQVHQLNLMASVEPHLLCAGFTPNPLSSYVWPSQGPLTSCFGDREAPDVAGKTEMHWGVDIAGEYRSPVKSAYSGTVHLAQVSGNYGNLVIVIGDDPQATQFWYGHLAEIHVTQGQKLQKGDEIGLLGNTGRSTGPHLHFETRPGGQEPVNPLTYYE
jgi:hypothetical protein